MHAELAQLDRVAGFEPVGRGFESLTPRHLAEFTKSPSRVEIAI